MAQNKLYSLMKALRTEELKDVAAYIQKEKPALMDCFGKLSEMHPDMREAEGTREALFSAAYKDKPFDDQKMRHLKVQFCRLIEGYLIQAELAIDDKFKNELLIKALAHRNNYRIFKDYATRRLKELDNLPERGRDYFLEKAHHFQLMYLHPGTEQMNEGDVYLKPFVDSTEMAYAYTLLEMATEHRLGLRIMQTMPESLSDENGLQMAANKSQGHPPLSLFYQLFQLYQNGDGADDLENLFQSLRNYLHQMDGMEKRLAVKLLANWPFQLSNQGSERHSRFIFEVFRFAVKNGLLPDLNGQINPGHFTNVVLSGVKVGELKWAEKLVEKHAHLLPSETKEVVVDLCLAAIYFGQGKQKRQPRYFKKVLNQLGDSPQRFAERYNLRYRTTAIRASFELIALGEDYMDELDKNIKNFERYLYKNRLLPDDAKQPYFRFMDFTKVLSRVAVATDKERQQVMSFFSEIKSDPPVAHQQWLLEKAEELLQSLRH